MAEIGIPYTLQTGAARAVFGVGDADPDWVGYLDAENGISQLLDPPPGRVGGGDMPGGDGGYDSSGGFVGQRHGTISGWVPPITPADTNARMEKLDRAMMCVDIDGVLSWTPSNDGAGLIDGDLFTTFSTSPAPWVNGSGSPSAPSTGLALVTDATVPGGFAAEFTTNASGQGVVRTFQTDGRRLYFTMLLKSTGTVAVTLRGPAGQVVTVPDVGPYLSTAYRMMVVDSSPMQLAPGTWSVVIESVSAAAVTRFQQVSMIGRGAFPRMLRVRRKTGPDVTGRRPKKWQAEMTSRDPWPLDLWETVGVGTATPSGGYQNVPMPVNGGDRRALVWHRFTFTDPGGGVSITDPAFPFATLLTVTKPGGGTDTIDLFPETGQAFRVSTGEDVYDWLTGAGTTGGGTLPILWDRMIPEPGETLVWRIPASASLVCHMRRRWFR